MAEGWPGIEALDSVFGEREFRAAAKQSNDDPIPRLLWLELRVPGRFSEPARSGIDARPRNESRSAAYLARLVRELAMLAPLFDRDRDVVRMHVGGGDPGFFSAGQLRDLVESLHWHFHFGGAGMRESSIEIDPRHLRAGDLEALASLGFGKLSLDVMAGQPLHASGGDVSCHMAEACAAIRDGQALGLRDIELLVDYGWPGQDVRCLGDALSELIALRPARMVLRDVAMLSRMYSPQQHHAIDGPAQSAATLGMYESAFEALVSAGYWSVGFGVFVWPDEKSTDTSAYHGMHAVLDGLSPHVHADLLGLGVGAISQVGSTCSQNARALTEWEEAIDAGHLPISRGRQFDAEDLLRADIRDQLVRRGELDLRSIERRHHVRFVEHFRGELRQLRKLAGLNLVALQADSIRATSRGRRVMSMISACFDRHAVRPPPEPTPIHRIA